jgi:putative acetyltransferase
MIRPATIEDHPEIIRLWERSVRATHHFLPEDYLNEIKLLLPTILPHADVYVLEDNNIMKGFAGVAEKKMEMLFIDPACIGKGYGRMLAEFCIHTLHADKVDVNEQNEQAVRFYKKIGYQQIGRQELDSTGKAFPVLELQYGTK